MKLRKWIFGAAIGIAALGAAAPAEARSAQIGNPWGCFGTATATTSGGSTWSNGSCNHALTRIELWYYCGSTRFYATRVGGPLSLRTVGSGCRVTSTAHTLVSSGGGSQKFYFSP